ncbi:MAG: hypothetical protein C4567_07985 [Deltaproteobacteria bacterium]|nr:MAG: hypothetical protein C4567_07985 [Deltaproteobacteria bacterium]
MPELGIRSRAPGFYLPAFLEALSWAVVETTVETMSEAIWEMRGNQEDFNEVLRLSHRNLGVFMRMHDQAAYEPLVRRGVAYLFEVE